MVAVVVAMVAILFAHVIGEEIVFGFLTHVVLQVPTGTIAKMSLKLWVIRRMG